MMDFEALHSIYCNLILQDIKSARKWGAKHLNFKIVNGVPQGSVLDPVLFSLHINDLSNVSNLETTLFADDNSLHISHNNQRWSF